MAGWMVSLGGWGLGCCDLLRMLLVEVFSEVRLLWWVRLRYVGADVVGVLEQVVELSRKHLLWGGQPVGGEGWGHWPMESRRRRGEERYG